MFFLFGYMDLMCFGCDSVDGDMSGKGMSCQKVLGFE